MYKRIFIPLLSSAILAVSGFAEVKVDLSNYGIYPNTGKNMSVKMENVIKDVAKRYEGENVTLCFTAGRYDFYPEKATQKSYFISNHDQDRSKYIGICVEGFQNLTIEGNGADIICHGRMLPIALVNSDNCTIRDISIDFAEPHITQVTVTDNGPDGITFETAPWTNVRINKAGKLEAFGHGWSNSPFMGMAFEPDTKHIVYNTSDVRCPLDSVIKLDKRTYRAPKWNNPKLVAGTIVTLRNGGRPAPAIFLEGCKNATLQNVTVHYAEGMGLLAELCENITLSHFNIALRGEKDPRYFTTQADATHFSGCKGIINSCDGLYENMMDDAINVHGTYLRVIEITGTRTLVGKYMHPQSYGFDWGYVGDSISFIRSSTMEIVGETNFIEKIEPKSYNEETGGVETFSITFAKDIPEEVNPEQKYGIENLTWTPSVIFARNTIRNNRARGCLFSTPRTTIVEDNLFDHTSGSAILLCGDCNGWYETGACRDVLIRGNRFINSLTSMFQFTEGVISIYPVIPDLKGQVNLFHGGAGFPGIRIEENIFETFDNPILFAKSTCGLKFTGNKIKWNKDFPTFHRNKYNFKLIKCTEVEINGNDFGEISPSILFE